MVNRRSHVAALVVACVLTLGIPATAAAQGHHTRAAVGDLRVDTMTNPIGVGNATPNLSWRLAGGHQSAYQIQVASSPSRLDRPDLWDSGKVRSDDTGNVGYAGAPLHSREAVIWRVRVWDDRMV
jgi:alpha-L-rhamnosidase